MILWKNDTVAAITKSQLIRVNRSLNDYVHLKKVNENLQMDLIVSDSLRFYWEHVALKTDTLYSMEAQKFEQLTDVNASLKAALKEEKKKNIGTCIGVGVGGTLLGILLGVLLGK